MPETMHCEAFLPMPPKRIDETTPLGEIVDILKMERFCIMIEIDAQRPGLERQELRMAQVSKWCKTFEGISRDLQSKSPVN